MNVPRPGAYKLAPRSRRGESKNAVPSKKPNRCCGADTDMSKRARAYSKVHSKIDRAASRERSLISLSAMLNVYLNAKKAARLRVPRLPEGPSQVQACHTTSPVRALVLAEIPRNALFKLCPASLHLGACEVSIAVVHGLKFTAVDGNAGFRQ